jgi:uncharacterized low-complexity protein
MATPKKVVNTRAISGTWVVTGTANYNPQATSARRTDLSWQALQAALKAGNGKCTVDEYLAAQAKANPGNTGDAMPCLRYWAGNGKLAIAG